MSEFQQRGAELVGCSIDSQYSHKAWEQQPRNKGGIAGLQIPLLADVTKTISRDYGVLDEAKGIIGAKTGVTGGGTTGQFDGNRIEFSFSSGNAGILAEALADAMRGMRKNPVVVDNLTGSPGEPQKLQPRTPPATGFSPSSTPYVPGPRPAPGPRPSPTSRPSSDGHSIHATWATHQ